MPRWLAKARRRTMGLVFALTMALGRLAMAQTEPIHIEYAAPSECPGSAEFVADVFARTARARLSETPEGVRTFVVTIERRGTAFAGSLTVREPDGNTTAREMTDEQCSEVASALALATSLAIDPNASLVPKASAEEAPTPVPPKPVSVSPEPSHESESSAASRAGGEPSTARGFAIALGPALATGIAPRLSLGGSLLLSWGTRVPDHAFSSLGVAFVFLSSASSSVGTASSSFRFMVARPELCTVGLVVSEDFGVGPCLGVELGAVTGKGSSIAEPATPTRFWLAIEPSLSARGYFSRAWFAEASAALVFPLTRYRFVFQNPDTPVHDVPVLGSLFSLGIGARFE